MGKVRWSAKQVAAAGRSLAGEEEKPARRSRGALYATPVCVICGGRMGSFRCLLDGRGSVVHWSCQDAAQDANERDVNDYSDQPDYPYR